MEGYDTWGFPAAPTGRPVPTFATEDPWSLSQPAPSVTEAAASVRMRHTEGQASEGQARMIDLEETQSDLCPSHFGDTQQVHRRLQFSQAPSVATWVDEASQPTEPLPASQFTSYFAKKKTYHKLRKHMKVDPQPRYLTLKNGAKLRYSTVCDPSEKENYLMCGHCSDQRLFKTMQILERHGLECPGKMQELLGSQVYANVQAPKPQQFPLPAPTLQIQRPQGSGMHMPNHVPQDPRGIHPGVARSVFSTPSHTMTTPNSSFPPLTQPSLSIFAPSQESQPHTQWQVMNDPIVNSQPVPPQSQELPTHTQWVMNDQAVNSQPVPQTVKGRVIFAQVQPSRGEACNADNELSGKSGHEGDLKAVPSNLSESQAENMAHTGKSMEYRQPVNGETAPRADKENLNSTETNQPEGKAREIQARAPNGKTPLGQESVVAKGDMRENVLVAKGDLRENVLVAKGGLRENVLATKGGRRKKPAKSRTRPETRKPGRNAQIEGAVEDEGEHVRRRTDKVAPKDESPSRLPNVSSIEVSGASEFGIRDAACDSVPPAKGKKRPNSAVSPPFKIPRPSEHNDALPYAYAKEYTGWFTQWRREDQLRLFGPLYSDLDKSQATSKGTQTLKSPSPLKEEDNSAASECSRDDGDLLLPTPCIASPPPDLRYLDIQPELDSPLFTDASPSSSRGDFCSHGAVDLPRPGARSRYREKRDQVAPIQSRHIARRENPYAVCFDKRRPDAAVRLDNKSGDYAKVRKNAKGADQSQHGAPAEQRSRNSAPGRRTVSSCLPKEELQEARSSSDTRLCALPEKRAPPRAKAPGSGAPHDAHYLSSRRAAACHKAPRGGNGYLSITTDAQADTRARAQDKQLRGGVGGSEVPAQVTPASEFGSQPLTSHRPPNKLQRSRMQNGFSPQTEPGVREKGNSPQVRPLERRPGESSIVDSRKSSAQTGGNATALRRRKVANVGPQEAARAVAPLSATTTRNDPRTSTPPTGSQSQNANSLRPMNKLQRNRAPRAGPAEKLQSDRKEPGASNPAPRSSAPVLSNATHAKLPPQNGPIFLPMSKDIPRKTHSATEIFRPQPCVKVAIAATRFALGVGRPPDSGACSASDARLRNNVVANQPKPATSSCLVRKPEKPKFASGGSTSLPFAEIRKVEVGSKLRTTKRATLWRETKPSSARTSSRAVKKKTKSAYQAKSPFNEKIAMQSILDRVMLAAARKPHMDTRSNKPTATRAPVSTRRPTSMEPEVLKRRSAFDKELPKRARVKNG